MNFLPISETKLKIVLSLDEMRQYGLCEKELNYSAPEVRESLWRILDAAKAACSFSVNGEKILVQLYPAAEGGEIFVTKLGALSKSAERSISTSGRVGMLTSEFKLYMFDGVRTAAAALAAAVALPDGAELLLAENGSVCLLFEEREEAGLAVIAEFGRELPASMEPYVRERSKPLSRAELMRRAAGGEP